MLLKRILLENFRQFKQANVPFHRGVTAIVGPNGAGKTTLIEAIGFALYGEQRGAKKTIVPIYAGGDKPRVTLWFELGGREYKISRDLNTAMFVDDTDDRVIAEGLTDVTREVERRLRLTYEQFVNSFCTEQKGLPFLQFRDRQRKIDELARMLGYDSLKVAARIADRRATEARGRREGAKLAAERLPEAQMEYEAAARELQSAKETRDAAESVYKQRLAALKELEPKWENATEALKLLHRIAGLEDQKRLLEQSASERETEVQEAERRLAERHALAMPAQRYEALVQERDALQLRKDAAEAQARLMTEIEHLERQIGEIEQRIAEIGTVDIEAAKKELEECTRAASEAEAEAEAQRKAWGERKAMAQHQVATLQERKSGIERELRQLESAVKDGVCTTCGQPLPGGRLPAQSEKEEALAAVINELAAAERTLTEAEAEPEAFKAAVDAVAQAREKVARASEAFTAVNARANVLQKEQESLNKIQQELRQKREALGEPVEFDASAWAKVMAEMASLEADYRRYLATADAESQHAAAAKRLEEARAKVASVGDEIERHLKSVQKSGLTEESASQIVQDYERLKGEVQVAAATQEAGEQRVADMEQRLATARQNLEAIEEAMREERAAAAEELLNKTLSKALEVLARELTERIRPELAKASSEYLAALSRGRYTEIELSAEFEPTLVDHFGAQTGRKHVISGGEQDIVMLSLRLGLSHLIRAQSGQPFGLLILDEVFGSLDEDRRQAVMEQLRELGHMFEQVLVISHVEGINEAADRVIEVYFDQNQRCSFVRGHDIAEAEAQLVGS
jgi:exonuclease SbcC